MIALSNNNQWTVEWYMCLPDNIHQFHVHNDLWISSKELVLVCAWQQIDFIRAVIF